jgi:hypothetical protein
LARIMCKLSVTSVTAITVAFVVMNLEKWLKGHFFALFFGLKTSLWASVGDILPIVTGSRDNHNPFGDLTLCVYQP